MDTAANTLPLPAAAKSSVIMRVSTEETSDAICTFTCSECSKSRTYTTSIDCSKCCDVAGKDCGDAYQMSTADKNILQNGQSSVKHLQRNSGKTTTSAKTLESMLATIGLPTRKDVHDFLKRNYRHIIGNANLKGTVYVKWLFSY